MSIGNSSAQESTILKLTISIIKLGIGSLFNKTQSRRGGTGGNKSLKIIE